MQNAFTLIELLVVMLIMALIIGVVAPQGSKMLASIERSTDHMRALQQISQEKALAFITLEKKQILFLDQNYSISIKGVLTKDAQ